jgi:hypothetical protein
VEPLDLHILIDASRERIRVLISDMLGLAVADGDLSATSWRDMADWSSELAAITRAIADAADRGELL